MQVKMDLEKRLESKVCYIILFLIYTVAYVLCELVFIDYREMIVKVLQYGIILMTCYIIFEYIEGLSHKEPSKVNTTYIIYLIMGIGILLRILRSYRLLWWDNQHDVYGASGHMDYIVEWLVGQNKLPDNYGNQYYHPPLHHVMSAMIIKLNVLLGVELETAKESLQYLTGFYSSAITLVCYKILRKLKLSKNKLIIGTGLIALAPTFIILGTSINNDVLMILLMFIVFLYLLHWYDEPTMKNILVVAVALGCSMMTKVSAVMCAPTLAVLFLIKLHEQKNWFDQSLWKQYIAFGLVSIPLGMWHSIRNLIKLGQPLGYVAQISIESDIYTGQYSFIERFLSFPFKEWLIDHPKCYPFDEYNLPTYVIKNALFNEYFPNCTDSMARLLIGLEIFMILLSLGMMIYYILQVKGNIVNKVVFGTTWALQVISFVFFNMKYPFGCTMDFRYIVPTLLTGVVFMMLTVDELEKKYPKIWKRLSFPFYGLTITYIALCSFVYFL